MRNQSLNAQEIKDWIQPIDFYHLEQGQLRNYKGKWAEAGHCPFHNDRSPGSFFINVQNGAYRCFSCNASGGDIIAFVMHKHQLSFKEALEWLVNEGGLR